MADEVETNPAPEAAPAAESHAEPEEQTPEQRFADVIAARNGGKKPEPAPAEEPTEEPPPAAAKPEDEKPADKKTEEKKPTNVELNLARAQKELRRVTGENATNKTRADTAEAKVKELETKLASGKKNPIKFLEDISEMSLPDLMAKAAKGDFDLTPPAELPPDVREMVEWAKQERALREEVARETKAAEQKHSDTQFVKDFIAENASEYPWLDENDIEPLRDFMLSEQKRLGDEFDPEVVAKHANEQNLKGHERTFTDEKLIGRLLVAVPRIKEVWSKALGANQQKPAASSSKQPAPAKPNIANQAEAVLRTERRKTADDERAEALKALKQHQERSMPG